MTTQYTSILKLALPVTGELSGTWGDVVNDNITSMVEEAIAGLATINSWSSNSHTLTTANGTSAEARCSMLVLTDTGTALTGAATVVCPTASKIYIVKNDCGQTATIQTSGGTGVAIPDGDTMFVFCDGTNVVQAVTRLIDADVSFTTLKGTGAVIVTNILDEDDMASDSATALATQQSIKAYVDAQISANNDLSEVLANGNTTGGTDLAVSAGDDITFTDTSKAIFGTDGDLEVYHDGSNAYATNTTGSVIVGASGLTVQNAAGTETLLTAAENGAVTAYYDNAAKLTTATDGVDITGDLRATGDARIGVENTDAVLTTYGTGNLTLSTNEGTNSGTIVIAQGVDGNITLDPNGTGKVAIDAAYVTGGTIDGTTIGGTTPAAGAFTTLSASGAVTLSGGTANGVAYLNGSKVLTTGSALTFNGSQLNVAGSILSQSLAVLPASAGAATLTLLDVDNRTLQIQSPSNVSVAKIQTTTNHDIIFGINSAEQMRLTSTGLGIGTSSPASILHAKASGNYGSVIIDNSSTTGGGALFARQNGSNKAIFGVSGFIEGNTSSDAGMFAETGGGLRFYVNGSSTPSATLDSSGNFGLGVTPSGSYKLEVGGGDALVYGLTVGRGAGAVSTNTAVGASALAANTTGYENTGLGYRTLTSVTTGGYNTGVGTNAGAAITTGGANTAVGRSALQTATTPSYNTAIGYRAMISTTTGGSNTAIGSEALQANTTGNSNTAIGLDTLKANTTGSYNVALGANALNSNTTASNNIAVGYQAGLSYTTGQKSTYVGNQAGYYNTTGTYNTFIGGSAGYTNTTGSSNTYVGSLNSSDTRGAGTAMTTGSNNTIIGNFDGNYGGLDIRTLSNYLVLSDGDGNPRIYHNGTTVVIPNLPTSSAGLPSGGLYVAAGVLMVA